MRRGLALAAATITVAAILLSAHPSRGQNVSPDTLRSVAAIVTGEGAHRTPIGTAFFVDVPSRLYPGNSFVYVVTARHNLLDEDGHPIEKLWLRIEDPVTGAVRDDPIPPENKWIIDPNDETADVAALPFPPAKAKLATVPLSWFLNQESATALSTEAQIGADAYYLAMTSTDGANPRFVAVTRFARVSVAEPARTEVPAAVAPAAAGAGAGGASAQKLCFLDGSSAPEFSGAPVFLRTPQRFVFWGMIETRTKDTSNRLFFGLIGVIPASYVAETVKAMAEAQESRGQGASPR